MDQKKQDRRVQDFLQRCLQSPFSRKLDLWNFLDIPRSRLVKYPLLLREILKHTANDHPDRQHLDEAVRKTKIAILHQFGSPDKAFKKTNTHDCYINLLSADMSQDAPSSQRQSRDSKAIDKDADRENPGCLFSVGRRLRAVEVHDCPTIHQLS